MKKKLSVLALTISLFTALLPAAPARAGLWVGACVVEVRMTFNSPVGLQGTNPSFNISMNSLVPNTCPVTPLDGDVLDLFRSTGASGNGSSTEWSCAAVLAGGQWSHGFSDSQGNQTPGTVTAGFTMAGTWDNWVLIATNGPFYGAVAYLKLAPLEHTKTVNCATTGLTSLRMIGVIVFEDPTI